MNPAAGSYIQKNGKSMVRHYRESLVSAKTETGQMAGPTVGTEKSTVLVFVCRGPTDADRSNNARRVLVSRQQEHTAGEWSPPARRDRNHARQLTEPIGVAVLERTG